MGRYQYTSVDVAYPPAILYLTVPFVFLPAVLWWVIPLATTGYCIWRLRPASWTFPVFALLAIWPRTAAIVLFGNTAMWLVAAVAVSLAFQPWVSALIFLKPSPAMLPFALIGIRHRSWWITSGVLLAASLPFAGLWVQYWHTS
jgi:hypothetical protein